MQATDKQIKEYLETGGNRCLYCKSRNIEGRYISTDDSGAEQPLSCNDCNEEWEDLYTRTGVRG